jgi:hypothetical protein
MMSFMHRANFRSARKSVLALAIAVLIELAAATAQARDDGLAHVLALRPKASASPDETHSALLITRKSYSGQVSFAGRVQTVWQIRTGSPPNPWECAWIVWNYRDAAHFYYLALKPNGWELGKRDPDYPGGQRFLASGSRKFAVGIWHRFLVSQAGATITGRVNGMQLVRFTDAERPYGGGQLGIYAEDSEVQVDGITMPFVDRFSHYRLQANKRDGSAMKNWITPFLGFGYAAIVTRAK